MSPRAPRAATPATEPTETGRQLVPLYVVTAFMVMINERDLARNAGGTGRPLVDRVYNRGEILPAELDRDTADRLVSRGLAACVVVRL